MSFLTVSHVSHSFGGRQILEDVSFKLEKGEHIGLVGANGEGKSTFFNLITNNLLPDDGQITWPGKIKVGYLDQMSSLENGKTIRDVLRTAFNEDFAAEQEMLELYDKMAEADEDTMNKMLARVGEIQSRLEHSGFYLKTLPTAWAWEISVWTGMWRIFPADSATRCCWPSCCCRIQIFCCWTNPPIIWMWSTSAG